MSCILHVPDVNELLWKYYYKCQCSYQSEYLCLSLLYIVRSGYWSHCLVYSEDLNAYWPVRVHHLTTVDQVCGSWESTAQTIGLAAPQQFLVGAVGKSY